MEIITSQPFYLDAPTAQGFRIDQRCYDLSLIFQLRAHHFQFRAIESVYFPPGKAGNVLRGALAGSLRFDAELVSRSGRPSGLADPPRPFALRAAHLNGRRFAPGETFSLDVHIFDLRADLRAPLADTFTRIFTSWADTGIGPRRGRVELLASSHDAVEIDLEDRPPASASSTFSVLFHTPTELKGIPAGEAMPFAVLFARVRDRISTLRNFYGEGPLPVDFRAQSERARLIRTTRCSLAYQNVERRSSRTGEVHGIGGVTGSADYEGELAEFLPYLRTAFWTGVGRHTVWGNGVIEVAAR